jgi:glutathione S-transferase
MAAPIDEVLVLWQLKTSIFSEKARWALDYKGLHYQRRNLTPGLHTYSLALRGRGTTVPVLDVGPRRIRDSTAIIAALEELQPEPPLYPDSDSKKTEALAFEDAFDEYCGHEVRRVVVDPLLADPKGVVSLLGDARPLIRRLARIGHPIVNKMTRLRYGISPRQVQEARLKVRAAFDQVEIRLDRGGRYLVGDRFSVADLTAASLLAPIVMPQEYPDPLLEPASLPAELDEFRALLAKRPAFRWVLDIYREHRGKSPRD